MAKSTCSINGCEKDKGPRGWCWMHYGRWYRNGDPEKQIRIRGDDEKRFWSKVDVGHPLGCWEWTSRLDKDGYGKFLITRDGVARLRMAHRQAYKRLIGPIPDGKQVDHLCRNRSCVNPDHLELVTLVENVMRGESIAARNARKTHCKHGHPFDDENTHITPRGRRRCRTCGRLRESGRL